MQSFVSTEVSPQDGMRTPGETLVRYLSVGQDAIRSIKRALDGRDPRSILDLPSGYGRVARHLAFEYPEAQLFVSDLDAEGAAFCARTFGAEPLPANADFDLCNFERRFELIWAGSLVTHLPESATEAFLRFVARHLSPTGVGVITTHGDLAAGRIMGGHIWKHNVYGVPLPGEQAMLEEFFVTGYGFGDYPNRSGYGISLASADWLGEAASRNGLELVAHRPHAWDNHQDVMVVGLPPAE
ncbi:MAG: class I SAM-dependent methyltransferase [Devosia sp.]|nr:class I SAM-dependent methyltransferase [Devosia sp.]